MLREYTEVASKWVQKFDTRHSSILKIHFLIQVAKKLPSLNLIEHNETTAKFQCHQNSLAKEIIKIYVSVVIKNNILQIKCFFSSNKQESKYVEKTLPEKLSVLSQRLVNPISLAKIYFDSKQRAIVVEGFINTQLRENYGKAELQTQFKFVVSESCQVLKQVEHIIFSKKKQGYQNILDMLKKTKQVFEDNRIKRQKSTRICLIQKNNDSPISKIVNNYKEFIQNNNPIIRTLYSKFKDRKQKLAKQPDELMKKLRQKIRKEKQGDETQDSEGSYSHIEGRQIKKMTKKFILKPICIFQQKFIEKLEPGGFGEVSKYKCVFQELDTVASDTQIFIQQQRRRLELNIERHQAVDILVRKNVKQDTKHSIQSIDTQFSCLKYLKHEQCPQIAQYFKILQKKQKDQNTNFISIYSKFYENKLSDFQKQTSQSRVKIFLDLAQGINFMVDNKILHRDLKPANIRLTNKKKVKIIDFGSACLSHGNQNLSQALGKDSTPFCFSQFYTLQYHKARLNNFSFQEFTRHFLYDMYAYGKIMGKFFGKVNGDSEFLMDNIKYISQKSMEANPQDRLSPQQILIFLRIILKALSFSSQI